MGPGTFAEWLARVGPTAERKRSCLGPKRKLGRRRLPRRADKEIEMSTLTLNKITSQRGISVGEATKKIADLGWNPSYVQEAMTFPTDYKITKAPRDPMKQVLRSYFPMQEEKDNRVYGALDAALRGDMFRNVEPRWVEWMKLAYPVDSHTH